MAIFHNFFFSVAIAAGRKLAHRIFNNEPNSRLEYENIPSVVFTHPPIGKKHQKHSVNSIFYYMK